MEMPDITDEKLKAAITEWHATEMQAAVRTLGEETAAINKAHSDERASELAAMRESHAASLAQLRESHAAALAAKDAAHNAEAVAAAGRIKALADEMLAATAEGRVAEKARIIAAKRAELAALEGK